MNAGLQDLETLHINCEIGITELTVTHGCQAL